MVDWSMKELMSIYSYSNINDDRKCTKSVRINGRLYDKHGVDCATTAVALEYKVFDPSVKQFKTAILVGIARQNPGDFIVNEEQGIEIATVNAMIEPIMKFEYKNRPNERIIYYILLSYVLGLPVQFVKTASELRAEGKDLTKFNRIQNRDAYNDYYKDFRKSFLD